MRRSRGYIPFVAPQTRLPADKEAGTRRRNKCGVACSRSLSRHLKTPKGMLSVLRYFLVSHQGMRIRALTICLLLGLLGGCGDFPVGSQAPLFSVPLTVNGESVGNAFVDTGGGYEVLLRQDYGVEIIDTVEVLAFGGTEKLQLTGPFVYSVAGFNTVAASALVGLSACDCNGLGFHFFNRTGVILGIDFSDSEAEFLLTPPKGGMSIPFTNPPDILAGFDSAFVEVEVTLDGESRRILGLLDTGSNVTVLRRGILGGEAVPSPSRLDITIEHENLGMVAVNTGLYDTDGLPDMIIGTDVMGTWAQRWYFDFTPGNGAVTVFFDDQPGNASDTAERLPTSAE